MAPVDWLRSVDTAWILTNAKDGLQNQKWSSTIGIVTAICGNILISFALNTQRYAHLRIGREQEQQEEKQREERKTQSRSEGYGTQQNEVAEARAEARAEANAKSQPSRYALEDGEESNEMAPLIPPVDKKKRSVSFAEDNEDEDEDDSAEKTSYLKSPIWWAGITMMTLGETGNFLAYGFAPASIVSPLGVVALISNCLIAPWLLKERFRWRDGVGVIIAVAGCVTVVMSASTSNPKLDPDTIWHLITRWEFETYLGITIFLIIVLMFASNRFGDKSILIDLGLMGLFGGYTALSTKGVASLLSNTIWRAVTFPITYLLVAVLVFTAVMQIKYVNRALQRFNATQVIPIQFVLFTLSVITGSAVLYQDFQRTSTEDAIKFVGGCALTFSGVWCITSGRNGESEDDEELGEEDAISLVDEEGVQPEIREREDSEGRRQSLLAGSSKNKRSSELEEVESPLYNETADLMPAQAAAIHSSSTADLPSEAPQPNKGLPAAPPMHATTSDPTVPTIGTISQPPPSTPMKRGFSAIDSPTKNAPSTPLTPASHYYTPQEGRLDPNQPPRLLSRHSVAGLLPGPFTSPLSSSLSAIVADSLRRGVDRFPTPSVRRRPKRMRTEQPASRLKRHSIASGQIDIDDDENPDDRRQSVPERPGRLRSVSATLGDIFGTPKRRKTGSQGEASRQAGKPDGNGL